MVDSRNMNDVIAAADELEKGDFEKRRGEVHETEVSDLLEPLLTPEEARHHDLAAASRPLVTADKVIVSLIVISFVLVEAYFVGRSFRQWHTNEHLNHDGKSMNSTEVFPTSLQFEHPLLSSMDGVKETLLTTPEPMEDFLEDNINWGEGLLGRKGLFDTATLEKKKMSSTLPQGTVVSPNLVPIPEEPY